MNFAFETPPHYLYWWRKLNLAALHFYFLFETPSPSIMFNVHDHDLLVLLNYIYLCMNINGFFKYSNWIVRILIVRLLITALMHASICIYDTHILFENLHINNLIYARLDAHDLWIWWMLFGQTAIFTPAIARIIERYDLLNGVNFNHEYERVFSAFIWKIHLGWFVNCWFFSLFFSYYWKD